MENYELEDNFQISNYIIKIKGPIPNYLPSNSPFNKKDLMFQK